MKVGELIWILLCLKLTIAQQWIPEPDALESRAPMTFQGYDKDMPHSNSKPEAYFLHFKQSPSDYSYRKQPSKFLLLLRLPDEDKAESAQKIAQVIEDSQAPFSAPQQQKMEEVGFDDVVQSRFKSVLQNKQEEAPIEQQRSVPWIPSSGVKSSPVDSPIQQSSYGSDAPLQQSHYGLAISAPKSAGGYKLGGVSHGVKSKAADAGGYGGFSSSAAGGGGYGGAKGAEGGYGGAKGAEKSDFGTKSAPGDGYGGGGAKGAPFGGYGGAPSASADGGYGGSGSLSSEGGYGSSGAIGAPSGGYGSSAARSAPSGGYASPLSKSFKSSLPESGVKGSEAAQKKINGGGGAPRTPSDYMRNAVAKAVQQAIKGDYGAKKSLGASLSSPGYSDMSALGGQMGYSDFSPKGVYFSQKESAVGSKCNCDDAQSAVSGDGYQRAESQAGLVNAGAISEADTKDDILGYGAEASGGDEGKIPVIFIGLPKKKEAPYA